MIEKRAFDALVSSNLRRLRKSEGLKLRELGDALGVTAQQLHKHEQGSGVSFWRAAHICRALEVPLSDLLPEELRAQLIPQVANAGASPLDAAALQLASRPNRRRPPHRPRAGRVLPA